GHLPGETVIDILAVDGEIVEVFESPRIDTPHTHGSGCTFSAAIAAGLARGLGVEQAVQKAKEYITGAIAQGQVFGHGINPVNHFWLVDKHFGKLND
ncbi:bifunctional hydroxymethylpyrimidine kinase/phosphomethylpyrimidine kinase, partial [bacterium]|nr:bifunctional hydroxymethylpyrimidine kinase/phosphomethylpyrimidine kinase [bacterium]